VAAEELLNWQRDGYGKPDFAGSLDAFRRAGAERR